MHASLYKRYDLAKGDFVTVGDTDGVYAREDSKTGAEYRCLGEGTKGKKVLHSSDLQPGLFYPENVFVGGRDENDESLPFEELEAFCKQSRYIKTKRVILPRGFDRGKMTWENVLTFSPIEAKPTWEFIPNIIKQQFPKAEIVYASDNMIEINL